MKYITETAEQTKELGKRLGEKVGPGTVVALNGPLGAGKTVLTKGLAQGLDVASTVTSPSFTIIVEHEGRIPLRHIDLYRTGSDEELELFGFGELTSGDCVTVIEWGEKAATFLDEDHILISFSILPDGKREIDVSGPTDVLGKLEEELAR